MSAVKKSIATTDQSCNAGRKIAVIGGGIGGLTAALAFARSGAQVDLYEQAPEFSEIGAGIQITPNGARALAHLGVAEALAQKGVTAQAVIPMDALSGRDIARFDLTQQQPAYRFYHRADLIDVLVSACRAAGVALHSGVAVRAVQDNGQFETDAGVHRADLTIGADGIHSVARAALGETAEPTFTGQVAWRAIIPAEDIEPVARIWMAPGAHVVTYPLREGLLNIVAVQERISWAKEGWRHKDHPENLRRAFAGCGWQLRGLLADVEEVGLWGLFRHPVAERWYGPGLALLGDAAHPTLPFLAQGANLAIEDAFELAAQTAQEPDLAEGLKWYQEVRRERVVRAISAAYANARNYHLSGAARQIAHFGLSAMGRFAPGAFLRRLSWIYDYDVTTEAASSAQPDQ